jgi:hypothetical protein
MIVPAGNQSIPPGRTGKRRVAGDSGVTDCHPELHGSIAEVVRVHQNGSQGRFPAP